MRHRAWAAALVLCACGGAGSTTVVSLNAQSAANQSGRAVLRAVGERVTVDLSISVPAGGEDAEQPSHLHAGRCGQSGEILSPLSDVKNGQSTSTVSRSLESLLGQSYVDVHADAATLGTSVSCGNIDP